VRKGRTRKLQGEKPTKTVRQGEGREEKLRIKEKNPWRRRLTNSGTSGQSAPKAEYIRHRRKEVWKVSPYTGPTARKNTWKKRKETLRRRGEGRVKVAINNEARSLKEETSNAVCDRIRAIGKMEFRRVAFGGRAQQTGGRIRVISIFLVLQPGSGKKE